MYRAKQTGRNAVYYAEVPRGDAVPARWARDPQEDTGGVARPGARAALDDKHPVSAYFDWFFCYEFLVNQAALFPAAWWIAARMRG